MGSTGRTHGETAVTTPATKATISNRITIDVLAGACASGAGVSWTTRRPRQPGRLHESRGTDLGSRTGAGQGVVPPRRKAVRPPCRPRVMLEQARGRPNRPGCYYDGPSSRLSIDSSPVASGGQSAGYVPRPDGYGGANACEVAARARVRDSGPPEHTLACGARRP
jgi:hypothetical protein